MSRLDRTALSQALDAWTRLLTKRHTLTHSQVLALATRNLYLAAHG